jgi:hypothetical protein
VCRSPVAVRGFGVGGNLLFVERDLLRGLCCSVETGVWRIGCDQVHTTPSIGPASRPTPRCRMAPCERARNIRRLWCSPVTQLAFTPHVPLTACALVGFCS